MGFTDIHGLFTILNTTTIIAISAAITIICRTLSKKTMSQY
jgi:hypothetical protein